MTEILLQRNSTSPFDQIKHIDTELGEHWIARELMPVLGYQQWRRFEESIERAITACENIGQDSKKHFLPTVAKSTGGRPGEDYKLSRHACYLVAMNGDPRKPQIAAAQTYFAIKTREAELAPQVEFEKLYQIIEEQGKAIALFQCVNF